MATPRAGSGTVTVRLRRSPIGTPESHRAAVRALGLRKLHQSATHPDTPQVRGLINKVGYLLEVVMP